ncbi:MAG: hypothetical protein JW896_17080, partial [Deltaproteobacteria bacterium]|nr:hypothetical protein [Deltaproteobacteria bacterium]
PCIRVNLKISGNPEAAFGARTVDIGVQSPSCSIVSLALTIALFPRIVVLLFELALFLCS